MFRQEFTMGCGEVARGGGGEVASGGAKGASGGAKEHPEGHGEFLQFTVGGYPRQNTL